MPGKYEGNADEVLAEFLEALSLDGAEESSGDVDTFNYHMTLLADVAGAWAGKRHFVLLVDDLGFVEYEEFSDALGAQARFEEFRNDYEAELEAAD